jgi:hypothetical protein
MARIGVSVKIDVLKIEKARLFRGAKGTYLDTTVFIDLDEADQYGNHGMVTQDVSKDERQADVKGPILGNVKVFYKDEATAQAPNYQQDAQAQYAKGQGQGAPSTGGFDDFEDSIPFAPLHSMMGG